ncbi:MULTISPECIES: hypothetical protein [Agrobacterium]|uniref:hypothetical protein n=1 Tax=Agrobacterium TaxID=357 RepID=UPI002300D166|nr:MULTISPECIES: hypothetical protein [Agrobacterium]MDA5636559.1 hypothetical protein [Agrobacterium sp. ST15.13.013]MDA6998697.1 hypothetical protein [Agrobacterium salinitolerans]
MTTFLEYSKSYEVKENEAVNAFLAALIRQKKAFETGETSRRSWVKEENGSFYIKLGKLAKTYRVTSRPDVSDFLHRAAQGAQNEAETDFRALIEEAYGSSDAAAENKPRRGRKPKNA